MKDDKHIESISNWVATYTVETLESETPTFGFTSERLARLAIIELIYAYKKTCAQQGGYSHNDLAAIKSKVDINIDLQDLLGTGSLDLPQRRFDLSEDFVEDLLNFSIQLKLISVIEGNSNAGRFQIIDIGSDIRVRLTLEPSTSNCILQIEKFPTNDSNVIEAFRNIQIELEDARISNGTLVVKPQDYELVDGKKNIGALLEKMQDKGFLSDYYTKLYGSSFFELVKLNAGSITSYWHKIIEFISENNDVAPFEVRKAIDNLQDLLIEKNIDFPTQAMCLEFFENLIVGFGANASVIKFLIYALGYAGFIGDALKEQGTGIINLDLGKIILNDNDSGNIRTKFRFFGVKVSIKEIADGGFSFVFNDFDSLEIIVYAKDQTITPQVDLYNKAMEFVD